jgi:hypothetical protein
MTDEMRKGIELENLEAIENISSSMINNDSLYTDMINNDSLYTDADKINDYGTRHILELADFQRDCEKKNKDSKTIKSRRINNNTMLDKDKLFVIIYVPIGPYSSRRIEPWFIHYMEEFKQHLDFDDSVKCLMIPTYEKDYRVEFATLNNDNTIQRINKQDTKIKL